jgi:Family of unknown function (DUF6527)
MRRSQTRVKRIIPEFVEFIPEKLRDGVLYISIPYATASHNCACGCGQKVVTPIKPMDWSVSWNGEDVSLDPSIGNWSFSCRSHYWIRNNKIVWSRPYSDFEVAMIREKDARWRDAYFKRHKHARKR